MDCKEAQSFFRMMIFKFNILYSINFFGVIIYIYKTNTLSNFGIRQGQIKPLFVILSKKEDFVQRIWLICNPHTMCVSFVDLSLTLAIYFTLIQIKGYILVLLIVFRANSFNLSWSIFDFGFVPGGNPNQNILEINCRINSMIEQAATRCCKDHWVWWITGNETYTFEPWLVRMVS